MSVRTSACFLALRASNLLRGILMFFEVQYTCRKSKNKYFCGKVLRVLQSIFPAAMSGETANFRKILAFS